MWELQSLTDYLVMNLKKKKKKKKDCLVTESYRLTRNLFGSIVIAELASICLLRHFLFLLGHLIHIAGIAC